MFKYFMKLFLSFLITIFSSFLLVAQRLPDKVFRASIKTVKLFPRNNQNALPVIELNALEQLELHFDDLDTYPKNYFYTYQLCNADWSEAEWSAFDFIKGFQQNRIGIYRISSIAQQKYVHYQTILPELNAIPSRSGNYLLKVFQDGDTAQLLFTKRFYVVDQQAVIGARFVQPFDFQMIKTHQKINLLVNVPKTNMINPQQYKAVILQNGRWDNASINISPTFIRGNNLEFNAEQDCIFPAGKEYRWLDMQGFRFQSDRIESIDRSIKPMEVNVKQDRARTNLQYLYYRDRNGFYDIMNTESVNPWWQSDYAKVNFSFMPDRGQVLNGTNVYLIGELTGNQVGDTSLMQYDAILGMYTKQLLLKQGYYSYAYITKDARSKSAKTENWLTEGNYWETENDYSIFFYYRSLGGRHDELIGYTILNSYNNRSGF